MALVRWEKLTSKYLMLGSLRLNPRTPKANRKGELAVLKRLGLFSSERVVLEVITVFEKVLSRLEQLGASYRSGGQLPELIKQALLSRPDPAVERSLVHRIEQTGTTMMQKPSVTNLIKLVFANKQVIRSAPAMQRRAVTIRPDR